MNDHNNLISQRDKPPIYDFIPASFLLVFISLAISAAAGSTDLFNEGIHLIPYPQEVNLTGEDFLLDRGMTIVVDRNASEADRFAATDLAAQLQQTWGVKAAMADTPAGKSIILTRKGVPRWHISI